MKITSIDAMQMPSGNAGASSRGAWSPVLVRVNTDEGVCGWGEAGLAYRNRPGADTGVHREGKCLHDSFKAPLHEIKNNSDLCVRRADGETDTAV